MAFKMKGSPIKRNFGLEVSPVKQNKEEIEKIPRIGLPEKVELRDQEDIDGYRPSAVGINLNTAEGRKKQREYENEYLRMLKGHETGIDPKTGKPIHELPAGEFPYGLANPFMEGGRERGMIDILNTSGDYKSVYKRPSEYDYNPEREQHLANITGDPLMMKKEK